MAYICQYKKWDYSNYLQELIKFDDFVFMILADTGTSLPNWH